jgi:5-methylcytosine-specific restriction enzyme A
MAWTVTLRTCSQPGCPELVERGACSRHDLTSDPRSSRNHRGVRRQDRGHGAEYDRYARAVVAAGESCRLRLPGCTGRATGGDYIVPLSRGGSPTWANLQPACVNCQRVQGGRLAAGAR